MILQLAIFLVAAAPLAAASLTYKAAIVELPAVYGNSAADTRRLSVNESLRYARDAKRAGAQIIVFPEYGITGFTDSTRDAYLQSLEQIPEPNGDVPCDNTSRYQLAPSIVSLSCGARDHGIAIVAGMGDLVHCPSADLSRSCASSRGGRLQFNTVVAFDTDGRFAAKHHKQNLWGEDAYVDVPQECRTATFRASFGVTFGLFICADVIHDFPAEEMVRAGVRNFVSPIAWSNDMAQMQAMSWHQGWSLRNCANVLFSNYPWQTGPGVGSSGSGIISCGRALASHYTVGSGPGPLLVAELDAAPPPAAATPANTPLQATSRSGSAGWKLAPLQAGRVCSDRVCCTASNVEGSTDGYALGALDGFDGGCGFNQVCNYPSLNWPAEVCALLACPSPTGSCLQYQIVDSSLGGHGPLRRVRLDVTLSTPVAVYPHVLASQCSPSPCPNEQVLLAPGPGFSFSQDGATATLQVNLSSGDALTSAILYGRRYGSAYESLGYTCPSAAPQPAQQFSMAAAKARIAGSLLLSLAAAFVQAGAGGEAARPRARTG